MRKLSYKSYADGELIRLLRENDDQKAYLEIYERYSRPLYAHARKRLGDPEDVKDLLQEVFTALWHNRYLLNPDTPLGGYLHATLRYSFIRLIAHQKTEARPCGALAEFHPADSASADDLARENELAQLIESEILHLPEKMQEVFRMSRQSHLSHKEIADRLDLSEATVKKHVNNALKVMRAKFEPLLSLVFFLFY